MPRGIYPTVNPTHYEYDKKGLDSDDGLDRRHKERFGNAWNSTEPVTSRGGHPSREPVDDRVEQFFVSAIVWNYSDESIEIDLTVFRLRDYESRQILHVDKQIDKISTTNTKKMHNQYCTRTR